MQNDSHDIGNITQSKFIELLVAKFKVRQTHALESLGTRWLLARTSDTLVISLHVQSDGTPSGDFVLVRSVYYSNKYGKVLNSQV